RHARQDPERDHPPRADGDPAKPLVYVLDSRAWSSLLVLEEECAHKNLPSPLSRIAAPEMRNWHSVYTVAPRQPFKTWLQKQPKRSRMLRDILEVLAENPDLDVQFVPVVIFWGRPVTKQKHWFSVLFAETWGFAGRTRTFFTILFHGKNTLVQFSEVIRFRDSINPQLSDDENIDNIQRRLADRLVEIKTATLGPDTSHRRTLIRELLLSETVQQAIRKRSREDNITGYKATLQARRYLYEIVSNRNTSTVRFLQILLTSFWNRFYSGIRIQHSEVLRKLALTHELVYVPCHRSHVDYLLLSYVIYYEGLAIPYIAAGKNLNMPVIGPVLRNAGAFFIRRSFKGNELYSTVLFEYLAKLISMGAPIEYFVEGGRSRTGRLLRPKPGMLAMTIRGFLKYRVRPVAFVPTYIGYEKMIEGKAYLSELSGKRKKSETLLGSLRSILRIRGEFGQVYASFGKPIFLSDILDQHNPRWHVEVYDDAQRPPWLRESVEHTATEIMVRINAAASVNPVNLVSVVLLASPRQHMDEDELATMLEKYATLIRASGYSERVTVTDLDGKAQIALTESLGLVKRKNHELGDIIYLDAKHAVFLTYYRNNILHLMVVSSAIACCFLSVASHGRDKIVELVSLAYPFLKSELFLPWDADALPGIIDHTLEMLVEQGFLSRSKKTGKYRKPTASSIEYGRLELLGKVVSPILELYYMTFALLLKKGSHSLTQPELIEL
ncbi:MAG TPA: glycerol-3-phosphate 1-O-acyltransferase PlsB, partial [Chromatiales bacterium]|nr:glycerol-3-phosphate 1-O-acyltransferase PlsB [Chromatiales bacterium]